MDVDPGAQSKSKSKSKAAKQAGRKSPQSRPGGKGEEKAPARGRVMKSSARGKVDGSRSQSKKRGSTGGRGSPSKSPGKERAKTQPPAARGGKSVIKAARSGGQKDDSSHVAFPRGTFLAFVDPSAEEQDGYRLGLVLEAVTTEDNGLSCDIFLASGEPLQFKRAARKQTVPDHTVVTEVKVEVLKATGSK